MVQAKELTDFQQNVIARLRKAGCHMVASETERHWRKGESYYIDTRVGVSKRLRADFNKANKQATLLYT